MKIVKKLVRKLRSIYWSMKTRSNITIHGPFTIVHPENVKIGDFCSINHGVFILGFSNITIGKNVTLSANVSLLDSGLDVNSKVRRHINSFIIIHDNVWVGAGSIILPGVEIGDGAVIGAGSVVTKNVASNTIVAGNPAKVIKCRK